MKYNVIKKALRNTIGAFLIFFGFCGVVSGSVWAGLFMMLSGITILSILYKKSTLDKIYKKAKLDRFFERAKMDKIVKYVGIFLPISLLIVSVICMGPSKQTKGSEVHKDETQVVNLKVTDLKFNESEVEINLNKSKELVLLVSPKDANIDNIEYCTSDDKIATITKVGSQKNDDNVSVKLSLKAVGEGECTVFAKLKDGIKSGDVSIKVIDRQRIEAEEKARKEEEARQEKEKKQEEAKKQEYSNNNSKSTSSSNSNEKSSNAKSNANNSHGKTIYVTPSGKRYHYKPNCAGKNATVSTLDEAEKRGLSPCQNCVH